MVAVLTLNLVGPRIFSKTKKNLFSFSLALPSPLLPILSSYLFAFLIYTSTPAILGRLSSYTPSTPSGWIFRAILSGHSSSSGYEIHPHTVPIESSEINSHSYPRISIDANQIKWIKVHFLILDFDWCPIEVLFTLHFISNELLLEA